MTAYWIGIVLLFVAANGYAYAYFKTGEPFMVIMNILAFLSLIAFAIHGINYAL